MTFYFDRSFPSIRSIVAPFREDQPRHEMTYERVVQLAHD